MRLRPQRRLLKWTWLIGKVLPLVVWTIIIHYQHNFHQHNEIERWSPMRWVSVCIDQADTNHTLPLKNKLSAGWMAKRVSSMSKWVSGVDRVMPWFNVKNLKRVGVRRFFAQSVILRFNLKYFDIFEDTWISKKTSIINSPNFIFSSLKPPLPGNQSPWT